MHPRRQIWNQSAAYSAVATTLVCPSIFTLILYTRFLYFHKLPVFTYIPSICTHSFHLHTLRSLHAQVLHFLHFHYPYSHHSPQYRAYHARSPSIYKHATRHTLIRKFHTSCTSTTPTATTHTIPCISRPRHTCPHHKANVPPTSTAQHSTAPTDSETKHTPNSCSKTRDTRMCSAVQCSAETLHPTSQRQATFPLPLPLLCNKAA